MKQLTLLNGFLKITSAVLDRNYAMIRLIENSSAGFNLLFLKPAQNLAVARNVFGRKVNSCMIGYYYTF